MRVLCLTALVLASAHGFFLVKEDDHPFAENAAMSSFHHDLFNSDHDEAVFMSTTQHGDHTQQRVTRVVDGAAHTTTRTRHSPQVAWEYEEEATPKVLSRCVSPKPALPEPPAPKRPCGCLACARAAKAKVAKQTMTQEKTPKELASKKHEVASPASIDYDEIVKETVQSVPPRNRGVRDEWGRRVGWGRREKVTEEHLGEDYNESSEADADADDEADETDADTGGEPVAKRFEATTWGTGRDGTGRRFTAGDFVEVKVLGRYGAWQGEQVTAVVQRAHKDGTYTLHHLDGAPVVPALKSGIRGRHLRHLDAPQTAAAATKEAARHQAEVAHMEAERAAAEAREQQAAAEERQHAAEERAAEEQAAEERAAEEARVRAHQEAEMHAAEEAQAAADAVLAQRLAEMEAMQQKYKVAQGQAERTAKALKLARFCRTHQHSSACVGQTH